MPAKKSKSAAKKPASKPAKKAPSKPAGKPKSKPSPAKKKTVSKKPVPKPLKKVPAKPAAKKAPAKKPAPKPAAKKVAAAKKPAAPAKKPAAPAKKAAPAKPASKTEKAPAPVLTKPRSAAPPTARVNRVRLEDEGATIDIAKGPVKMTPFLKKQKQRLVELRDAYLNSIEGVASETFREGADASAFGMHQADAGSDAYDRDFALSLLGKEQDALYEINEALKRIETGTYGICEGTGQKIPEERLEAMPFARFSVAWQEKIEREQRRGGWNRPVHSLFGLDNTDDVDDDKDEDEAPASSSNNNSGESLDFSKE